MAIRYENESDIPEDEKGDFVKWTEKEEGGAEKTVYIHKELAASRKAAFKLQGDFTNYKTETDSKVKALEDAEAERKRKADEAEDDKKKKDGKWEELLDDANKRADDAKTAADDRVKEIERKYAEEKKNAMVKDVAALGTDATRNVLERVVAADLELQDDGKIIILGPDGKATAETFEQYKAGLAERYPALVKAVQSKGGDGKGSGGADDHSSMNGVGKLTKQMVSKVKALGDLPPR